MKPSTSTSVSALLIALLAVLPRSVPLAFAQNDAMPSAEEATAPSDVIPDELDQRTKLPAGSRDHWVWVSDRLLRHNQLFDGDTGRALGTLDVAISLGARLPLTSRELGELYVVESVYSRGHRGTRADYVTIYDADTLALKGDIAIAPHSAETGSSTALTAILDGGRYLVVYNQAPQSVTVVDVKLRREVGGIDIAGCACVYPTGESSFAALCGDGTVLEVLLDADGREAGMRRTEKFFDVVDDPLRESGVRIGKRWLFTSFEGYLHEVDFSGDQPRLAARWSLFTDEERDEDWRIGGVQHLTLHAKSGELYSIVHKGGSGTHKDPGADIWVYDLAERKRTRTITAPGLMLAFVRPVLGIERDSVWFRLLAYVEGVLGGPGIHSMVVTQDAEPLLFVRNSEIGAVGVLDARTGLTLREIEEVGINGANLAVP